MTQTALILGATGRFGRAASTAFRAAGWRVTEWRRPNASGEGANDPTVIYGDLFDAPALAKAAEVDVIVNALNPPYPAWAAEVPQMTQAVIAAAKATGATVLIPGNVYNYGSALPPRLTAHTPEVGDHRKAAIRIAMEAAYREAKVPTIVLRAGDFIDTAPGENWFEGQITAKAAKGKVMYPGPTDRDHAWAYLPDLARAAELAARRREALPRFTALGFPGYTLTGEDLMDLIDAAMGQKIRRGGMPWGLIRLMGLINPMMREVYEMRYLWDRPHQIDGTDFSALFPDFRPTPTAEAIRASLVGTGQMRGTALAPAGGLAITA